MSSGLITSLKMAWTFIVFLLVASTKAYEELEWRKNAIPNYDLDYMVFGKNTVLKNIGVNPHIVGGDEVVRHSRPYQAGLYIPTAAGGTSFCGGSLINVQTILTAAHCVDSTPGNISIILGAHNIIQVEVTQQTRYSSDIVIHPEWDRASLNNDIAIIRVEEPYVINEHVSTILLPRNADHLYVGNHTLVSGWGRPSDSINSISPLLREVSAPIISNRACGMAYMSTLNSSHICLNGGYGRGTCNGDSGGPLTLNGVQIGVVSFGSSMGCEVGWPAVFARTTSYLEWIAQNSADVTAQNSGFQGNNEDLSKRKLNGPLDPEFNVQQMPAY